MTTTRTHLAVQYRTATTSNTSLEGSLHSLRFSTALVTTHGICDIILTPCCVMCLCTWQFDAASVIPWGRRVSCRSGAHNTDNYNHYPSQSWLASMTMTKLSPTETQFTFFYKQWKYNSHHRQSWINHFYYYITSLPAWGKCSSCVKKSYWRKSLETFTLYKGCSYECISFTRSLSLVIWYGINYTGTDTL